MDNKTKSSLIYEIDKFRKLRKKMPDYEIKHFLFNIFYPVLIEMGYDVSESFSNNRLQRGKEYIGIGRQHLEIMIPLKGDSSPDKRISCRFYKGKIGDGEIKGLMYPSTRQLKIIALTDGRVFEEDLQKYESRHSGLFPLFSLFNLETLKQWIVNTSGNEDDEVHYVLRNFVQELIKLILKNPDTFNAIEWRDLERVLAEVYSGIGYKVELTSSSKDGGKDLILSCYSKKTKRSFIVEIKHWRSGKKVGNNVAKDFIRVIIKEQRDAGLLLSTSGFTSNLAHSLTMVEKKKIQFGGKEKIVSLCNTYTQIKQGIWKKEIDLDNIFWNATTSIDIDSLKYLS